MTVLFSDTFESGNLSAWTGTEGTIAASGAAAHTGSFGCDVNSSDAFAYKDYTVPASLFVSHRADVKFVTASGSGQFRILQMNQDIASVAMLIYDNGAYKLRLKNSDTTVQLSAPFGSVDTGTWHEVRLDYDWSLGQNFTATAYIDGVQGAQLTNASEGGVIWEIGRIFILTFEDVAATSTHAYFDAVSVEDTPPSAPAIGQPLTLRRRGSTEPTGAGRIGRGW